MARKAKQSYETEKEPFPTRLRELIKEKNITQNELASKIGVTRQAISLYTSGQSKPDISILKKITEYFEVPADYLLGLSDNRYSENMFLGKELGLSDKAIEQIKLIKEFSLEQRFKSKTAPIDILNFILGLKEGDFLFLLCDIFQYFELDYVNNTKIHDVLQINKEVGKKNNKSVPKVFSRKSSPDINIMEDVLLYRIQKNFINTIQEIKEIQKTKEDKRNG